MGPFVNFFYTDTIYKKIEKNAKNVKRLCPLPYEEVLEAIIKTVLIEQCGNHEEMRYPGEVALVAQGKHGWGFVCRSYSSTWGAPCTLNDKNVIHFYF